MSACPYDDPACTGRHSASVGKAGMCPSAYARLISKVRDYKAANRDEIRAKARGEYAATHEPLVPMSRDERAEYDRQRTRRYRERNSERVRAARAARREQTAAQWREYRASPVGRAAYRRSRQRRRELAAAAAIELRARRA